MKIALTVWGNRISPVFDSAGTLLVAEIEDNRVVKKRYESFDPGAAPAPETLREMGVSVLICGAISRIPADLIVSAGITLIPFITGNAARVLEMYVKNDPVPPAYFMPGCGRCGLRNGLKNAAFHFNW
ncbi:MAG: NifB/NifX family molybdenum-iron cluster-binding protein [Desulfobacteraceae bacterium]